MAKEILSIRLSADGLSFWTGGVAGGDGVEESCSNPVSYSLNTASLEESVRESAGEYKGILSARGVALPQQKIVYADTMESVLIPDQLFRECDAPKYMAFHGFTAREGSYTVCSKSIAGTVAVMNLSKKVMEVLGNELGQFSVAHIQQYNMVYDPAGLQAGVPHIRVYLSQALCHMAAFSREGLAAAETYPFGSLADIVYYITCLTPCHGLGDCKVYIRGERADEAARLIARSNINTLCG